MSRVPPEKPRQLAYDAYYLRPANKQGATGDVYLVRERWGVAKSRAMQVHARL
jgi:hypothetical protein